MTRPLYLLETILTLLAVVLVMANGSVFFTRIDLTENRLHTISQATREILEPIENTVTITYYLSDRLRQRYAQPRDVLDLLEEYEAASRGAVRVRVIDPADLDNPDAAATLGIVAQQLEVTEDGERRSAVVYSGIVIDYLERRDSLPFVFTPSALEYELSTRIHDLVRDDRRSLAFVLGNPADSLEGDYRLLSTELSTRYDIRWIRVGEPIPDDIDVALVLDAGYLDGEQIDAISGYLDRGGAALFAFDVVGVDIAAGLEPTPLAGDAGRELLARFGVVLGDRLVLDESHNEILVEEETATFRVQRSYPYPHWPATLTRYTSSSHPITARFPGLDLYWPTWLEVDTAGSDASIIVASSPRAWLMNPPVELSPQAASGLARDAGQTRGQYGLVAVSRSDSPAGGRIAVAADADFLRDRLIEATGSAENLVFAMNLTEWLSNDEALLEIRTRPLRSLALDAVDEPRAEATIEFFAALINLALVPGGVVLYGWIRLAQRRRRSRVGARHEAERGRA